jgi:hypothetical protein
MPAKWAQGFEFKPQYCQKKKKRKKNSVEKWNPKLSKNGSFFDPFSCDVWFGVPCARGGMAPWWYARVLPHKSFQLQVQRHVEKLELTLGYLQRRNGKNATNQKFFWDWAGEHLATTAFISLLFFYILCQCCGVLEQILTQNPSSKTF